MQNLVVAGGCFWGLQELFRSHKGVNNTLVGYCGGDTENPTYETVCTGDTGHAEALQIGFDPETISREELLHFFFSIHDPTTPNQQGNDRGTQYRSVIFYQSAEEQEQALKVIKEINQQGRWPRPIVTEVLPLKKFYAAEPHHQDYLQKNPHGYTCHFQRYEV
jgi:peptide-methionine (S)-S-oxide reductase